MFRWSHGKIVWPWQFHPTIGNQNRTPEIVGRADNFLQVSTKQIHGASACSAGADMIVYDRGLLLLAGLVWEKYCSGWKFTIVYDQTNRLHIWTGPSTAWTLASRLPEPSLARVVECFLRSKHSFVCFIAHFHWLYTSQILRNQICSKSKFSKFD